VLEPIGLDDFAERAYQVLLRRESLTAPTLAELHDLPQARARLTLDTLVTAGLATCRPGRPTHYVPVDPRTGLTSLIRAGGRSWSASPPRWTPTPPTSTSAACALIPVCWSR
jgi:sugar-specific transcriptional regulator TrmB